MHYAMRSKAEKLFQTDLGLFKWLYDSNRTSWSIYGYMKIYLLKMAHLHPGKRTQPTSFILLLFNLNSFYRLADTVPDSMHKL